MPAGGKVDRAIKKLMDKGYTKKQAIKILKSKGVIKQAGKHLAPGKK